ncbi:MAG TPA: S9 family peptidase [Candidatus Acidoferrales bacterium]|nr:S9 family peptidase [Candidatus Acidoferrales bacterium]
MSLNRTTLFIICAAILAAWPAATLAQSNPKLPPAAAPRNLTVDDFFALQDVARAQISPDGIWVAYTVRTLDLAEDKSHTQIWMVPAAGGEAVPLTAKGVNSSSPHWSPDGKHLAFLSARGEGAKTQIWTLYMGGGEAQQLTDTIQSVNAFEWSPAGDRIALVLQDPSPEEIDTARRAKAGEKPKKTGPPPWVIDRQQFKFDTVGYLDDRRTHLYVLDVASKKMTQVTSGDYDDSEPAWSPDGRFLAFTSNRTEIPDANYNTDIWVVAADNPDKGKNLVRVTSNPGSDHSPAWSPDGKWIACVSQMDAQALDYATHHLVVVPALGGQARVLTQKLDRNIRNPRFSPDGQSIFAMIEEDGVQPLARISVAAGEITRLTPGRLTVHDFSFNREGALALTVGESDRPSEVFALSSRELRRLSRVNDAFLAQVRLGKVEYAKVKGKDGVEVAGYITYPPGYNSELRYPTILRPHGGPVSQTAADFDFTAQLFAANGYVVLQPNYRGSAGYGQAFSQAIFADWGNKEYLDLMTFLDAIVARGIADPDRLGVGGWSYGGIMTDYCIIKTDRFKAAISGASEVLYITNYGHDHYQRQYNTEFGPPWNNRALYEKLSPFNSVEKIVTPTLIMGGDQDWNVPIINSEQLYQALKVLGRTTQLVVYPGEYHGFTKPTHLRDRFERYLAWYAKYLKGEGSGVPPSRTAGE